MMDEYTGETWGGYCSECGATKCWLTREGLCGECDEAKEEEDAGS